MERVDDQAIAQASIKHFDVPALLGNLHLRRSRLSRGVDRQDVDAFERTALDVLKTVSEKLNKGTLKFSPYLEKLVSKGRNRNPRLIARPTVRDKLALWALKDVLHEILPNKVPNALPNQVVRALVLELTLQPGRSIVRFDIESFYDRINQRKLLEILQGHLGDSTIIDLVASSIRSPIVPAAFRKSELQKYISDSGVPQGLPISNFLAHIYLTELDEQMNVKNIAYFRYVDDILLVVPEHLVDEASEQLRTLLAKIELKPNAEKSKSFKFEQDFEFLGYQFCRGLARPKRASFDKYLRSVAALFNCLRRKTLPRRGDFKSWSDGDFAELFINELNEMITGAISAGKQYGWVFYFNESNDLRDFALADSVISKFARRTDLLTNNQRSRIKRCVRSVYETRHSKGAGYIKNYDKIETAGDKINFLRRYGYVRDHEMPSISEVERLYEITLEARLSRLERDIGFIS